MSLPLVAPLTRRDLARFDRRVSLPVASRVLRAHLGGATLLRVLARYAVACLTDPLRHLDDGGWPPAREVLVRHQLRAAVRLDDALRGVVDDGLRLAALEQVVSETGAEFIRVVLPLPSVEAWDAASPAERETWLRAAVARFFNAEADAFSTGPRDLGFDVTACRFVELTRALGRPWLAPLLCAADSVFFSRPGSPVRLDRAGTLATGADRCDFRFHFSED